MIAVTKLECLREVALDQHGLITTKQAEAAGISRSDLSKLVARKRISHIAHGLYRIPQVPETEWDQYQEAILWTGAAEACISHESALALWGLSDANPELIHLTVSPTRRLRRTGGTTYRIYREDLEEKEVGRCQGIRTATASTAVAQCIASGYPTYLIRQAIEQGSASSLIPPAFRSTLENQLRDRDEGRDDE